MKRPKRMECSCCGRSCVNRQHRNRDTGYGVCTACVKWMRERGADDEEIKNGYGTEGVNFSIPGHPDDKE